MDDIKYCRHEVLKNGKSEPCGNRIMKKNCLAWCESCRAHLPLWPADAVLPEVINANPD